MALTRASLMAKVLILLHLMALCHASFMPSESAKRQLELYRSAECQKGSCVLNWTGQGPSRPDVAQFLDSNCSRIGRFDKVLLKFFDESKVEQKLVHSRHSVKVLLTCPDSCGPKIAPIFYHVLQLQLQYANVFIRKPDIGVRISPWPANYARAWGVTAYFGVYFSFLGLPVNLFLNSLNLATMEKLINGHKSPAVSLYLHKAEIYTDILVNFVYVLYNSWFMDSLNVVFASCMPAYSLFLSLHSFDTVIIRLLMFINQRIILNILSDRLSAIADPLSYDGRNSASAARRMMFYTVSSSVLLYTPLVALNAIDPLVGHWMRLSQDLYSVFAAVMLGISGFYSLLPVICVALQVYRGIKYQRIYEQQLNSMLSGSTANREQWNEVKKNESEKRKLLAGTVILNVVATAVNVVLSGLDSDIILKFLGYPWWSVLGYIFDMLFVFLNVTLSFLIHLVMLKAYRNAFWQTSFGLGVGKLWRKLF